MIYERQKNPGFWLKIREDKKHTAIIEKIKKEYESFAVQGISTLNYSKRKLFWENGDRSEFENVYFSRRSFLIRSFILSLLYPENSEYLKNTQDIMWAICEEYEWTLPAHIDFTKIDLFSSETALLLTECLEFLGDRIDRKVRDVVSENVKRRVIDVYENGYFIWDDITDNWAAVCAGCIGMTMMYAYKEKFEIYLPRLLKTMDCFLSGFSDEGICFEGPSYWNYGFENFVWFADALKTYSNGKINLFENEIVQKVASYPCYATLGINSSVSFADSSRDIGFDWTVLKYIDKNVVKLNATFKKKYCWDSIYCGNRENFILRYFLFDFSDDDIVGNEKTDCFLKSASQVIINRENYSFAIKGGDNDELHNHNDIGSFIFADGDGQALTDLGWGFYSREYFSDILEERYAIFCNSSLSHSVPIINGNGQSAGKEYSGSIDFSDEVITVDMKNGYSTNAIKKLLRNVKLLPNGVEINDTFDGDILSFTDRFVTERKPEVKKGSVTLGKTEISFNDSEMELTVNTEVHKNHEGINETVYLLDFTPKNKIKTLKYIINT